MATAGSGVTSAHLGGMSEEEYLRKYQALLKPCHLVLPHLYLGYLTLASELELLREHGITHVLCCLGSEHEYHKDAIQYQSIAMEDDEGFDILPHLPAAVRWIEGSLASSETATVAVHCHAGVSRSATVVIAYVMSSLGMSADGATRFVQARREVANPNPGFQRALKAFERHLARDAPS